jgi:hypothetical protein
MSQKLVCINTYMKAITPASYQKVFGITPGISTVAPHRGLLLTYSSSINSIGLKFFDGTGVTLSNLGTIGTSDIYPIIANQVISTSGLTAYGVV